MLSASLRQNIAFSLQTVLQKDVSIQNVQQVFGGDINQTFLLETTKGKFFVKTNADMRGDMFEKESNGLSLLGSTNAIRVPKPIVYGSFEGTIFLVMEYIEKGKPAKDFWQQFGYGLAALHKVTQPQFGLSENNYIGSIPQSNTHADTWAEFYAQKRIMPLMQQALKQGKCAIGDVRSAEKLCNKFESLFPKEPPALVHGDLWGGNFMVAENGQAVIYDPAVYYGHREMDIAMTLLFGGFDSQFYTYYNEAYALQPGWQKRVSLYQLYPLLVHLLLFEGHYYNSVMDIIKTAS